jgi:hypothetical protein
MRLSGMQCEPRSHGATLIRLVPSGLIQLQDVSTEFAFQIVMILQVLASATVAFSDVLVDLI